MKKQQEHVMDLLFSLSLLCVFTACGLMVVFLGIHVYQNTVDDMSDAFATRTAMSYIAKKVRQNDWKDGVSLTEIEGQTALTFTQEKDGEVFCTYIYYYNGYLQELYAKESFSPLLSAGQALIAIDEFTAVQNENGTLTISITQAEQSPSTLILALQSSAA